VGRINWARVSLGAVVCFVVSFILQILWGLVMEKRIMAAIPEELRQMMMSPAAMAVFVAFSLMVSFVAIWIYAAIRPRYGPGPRTAVVAGVMVWALTGVSATVTHWSLRIMPSDLLAICLVWALVATVVATMAGAWAYRES
jgi:hypothetical protein